IAPNTPGADGSLYHVKLLLGTVVTTVQSCALPSLSTVRYFLDCTFSGLPGCTDDGDVMHFAENISTTCGVIWTPDFADPNTVDLDRKSVVEVQGNEPLRPGLC